MGGILTVIGGMRQTDWRASIRRDDRGIPRIEGRTLDDCRFGLGFAMATDRLWQLDYLRRRAVGEVAAVLGPSSVGLDMEARTIGFERIARRKLRASAPRTKRALAAFSAGINRAIVEGSARAPEFDALGYTPAGWSPVDSVAIMTLFAWQLSGRLHWLTGPELVRQTLPAGLSDLFLEVVGDQVSTVGDQRGSMPFAAPDRDATVGSNAWAIAGRGSTTGHPIVASDPHLPMEAPSVWYESHSRADEGEVAGINHVGIPMCMAGRNEHVAWGFTNNLCSVRDLYSEPGPAVAMGVVRIAVRDAETVVAEVGRTRRGPIVDRLLAEPFRDSGPISLRWTGSLPGHELGAMLDFEVARDAPEFLAALDAWVCPTWNFVLADDTGAVAYKCAGTIPLRGRQHLGIRDSDDPRDRWIDLVGTASLPTELDPDRGWVATTNNLVSFDDPVTLQSGFWPGSDRAERLSELLSGEDSISVSTTCAHQLDTLSVRARRLLPTLLAHLDHADLDGGGSTPLAVLRAWDMRFDRASAGATVFETFLQHWIDVVVAERIETPAAAVVAPRGEALACRLLAGDDVGWFKDDSVSIAERVATTFRQAIAELGERFGPDVDSWTWSRVHTLTQRHPAEPLLGTSVSLGPVGVDGGWNTLNNAAYGMAAPFAVVTGVSHRLVASLGPGGGLLSASSTGSSGIPDDPHFADGRDALVDGRYHEIWNGPTS